MVLQDGAHLAGGIRLGALGLLGDRRLHPVRARHGPQHPLGKNVAHGEAEGVAQPGALVARVARRHSLHDEEWVARVQRPRREVDILSERCVGERELARQRRTVCEGAEEDALIEYLVELESWQRRQEGERKHRHVAVATGYGLDLRAHAVRLVEVVVVPV